MKVIYIYIYIYIYIPVKVGVLEDCRTSSIYSIGEVLNAHVITEQV